MRRADGAARLRSFAAPPAKTDQPAIPQSRFDNALMRCEDVLQKFLVIPAQCGNLSSIHKYSAFDCDFGPKAQTFCQPGLKRSGGPGQRTQSIVQDQRSVITNMMGHLTWPAASLWARLWERLARSGRKPSAFWTANAIYV